MVKLLQSRSMTEDALPVNTITCSPDGRLLAAGGGTIDTPGSAYLWGAGGPGPYRRLDAYTRTVTCLAFSGDSKRLAAACQSADRVELWDAGTEGSPVTLPLLPPEPRRNAAGLLQTSTHVAQMAFSSDGGLLAAGCWDGRAKVWDLATGALTELGRPHRYNVDFVAFLEGDRQMLTGTADALFVWDLAAGQCVRRLELDASEPWRHLSALSTGNVLSISHKGRIRVWRVEDWSFEEYSLPRLKPRISALSYSDRARILAVGLEDGRILFWSAETRSPAGKWPMGALVASLAFAPEAPCLYALLAPPRSQVLCCDYAL